MNTTSASSQYPAFSPYLAIRDAAKAIEFYKAAFGATERFRLADKNTGKIGHAEILINGALVMLSEENPQWGNISPQTLNGTPITFCLIVENADAAFARTQMIVCDGMNVRTRGRRQHEQGDSGQPACGTNVV